MPRTSAGFAITRTLPVTYFYGIYRHVCSVHNVLYWIYNCVRTLPAMYVYGIYGTVHKKHYDNSICFLTLLSNLPSVIREYFS